MTIKGIQNFCFPIRLATSWECVNSPLFTTYTNNGVFTHPIPGPIPCPPSTCRLLGISLDNATFIGPNETRRYVVGNCCYLVHYGFDASNNCIAITINPCFDSEG